LAFFAVVAACIYVRRRRLGAVERGFWGWLLPQTVYRPASTLTDVKLFLANVFFRATGLQHRPVGGVRLMGYTDTPARWFW